MKGLPLALAVSFTLTACAQSPNAGPKIDMVSQSANKMTEQPQFSYRIGNASLQSNEEFEPVDTGKKTSYERKDTIALSLRSAEDIKGLTDKFNLKVKKQSVVHTPQFTDAKNHIVIPSTTTKEASPRYLVTAVALETEDLSDLVPLATKLGVNGNWTFPNKNAAAKWHRILKLNEALKSIGGRVWPSRVV